MGSSFHAETQSRSSCPSNQASRRLRTSGRSCSAACAVFFACVAVAGKKPPERAVAEAQALLGQLCAQFLQRHLAVRVERREDGDSVRLDDVGFAVAAERAGPGFAAQPGNLPPTADAGGTDLEAFRRLAVGQAIILHGPQNPQAQVQRQRFRHPCRPPIPADSLNQNSAFSGRPADSIRRDAALVVWSRALMVRIDSEPLRLCRPCFADEFVWCEAA